MPIEKEVLTTGEVAKICQVAPRTVSKWFDSGALKGYRIPGSKDRRIPVSNLIKFMKENNIPLDGFRSNKTRVLVVDDEADVRDILARTLTEQGRFEVKSASTVFQAGIEAERFRPHVILLDLHLSDEESTAMPSIIRTEDDLQLTRLIAMSGKLNDQQGASLRSQGFDSFLRKPMPVRAVIEAIDAATALVH
ncbi:MAG: response regulator [Planctomycetaceae bacterium]|jgi:excisionase family DNA binding protein|nr:response regulator [Phycisphaerales bacterium]MCE2653302.1 response regulator [Planctomycetaceae bacterium]